MSWLWRSDSSTNSFEKALSKLSGQIANANVSLERTRSTGRRTKALWTLYTSLAYIVTAIVLVLVVGPDNWTIVHYAGLVITPFLVHAGRRGLSAAFQWRASRQQAHLNRLQKQREEKISELKKATKYDSTQELLQKYGGVPTKDKQQKDQKQETKKRGKDTQQQPQRTGLPPPPTANIPSNVPSSMLRQSPHTPQRPLQQIPAYPPDSGSPEQPGFAPNAFASVPDTRAIYEQTPHWYDRILDVLLGEDENLAKNRLVLLCQSCRLVNGQAPPGVKTLQELGKWRCSSCGMWNGVENETVKVAADMTEKSPSTASEEWQQVSRGDDGHHFDEDHGDDSATVSHEKTAGVEGSTSADSGHDTDGMTKRVTRSTGKVDADGL